MPNCNSAKATNTACIAKKKVSTFGELVKPCMPCFFRSRLVPTTYMNITKLHQNYSRGINIKVTQSGYMHQRTNILQATKISHLGKRNIIKSTFKGMDMLVSKGGIDLPISGVTSRGFPISIGWASVSRSSSSCALNGCTVDQSSWPLVSVPKGVWVVPGVNNQKGSNVFSLVPWF